MTPKSDPVTSKLSSSMSTANVRSDGSFADHQLGGDRPVGPARRHQLEHLHLTGRQPALDSTRQDSGELVDLGKIGPGLQLLHHRAGGVELDLGTVVVSQRSTGEPDQHTSPRPLVRRPQFAPPGRCPTERTKRRATVALGEKDCPRRMRRERGQQRRFSRGGDRGELVDGSARRVDIAGGEQDLHVRG
jgi:hypothetical protein